MAKHKVFLFGATGETGSAILDALIADGDFDVVCFIRTASAQKPTVQALRDRGLNIVVGDISDSIETLTAHLRGVQTVIAAIHPFKITAQIPLINASVAAGVSRFVPCNWGTPSPRGGIMDMRDKKEEIHDHIFRAKLGFTIIDVGFWYEMSFPRVPSGAFDYATFVTIDEVFAGGTARNMLTSRKDVGVFTAKIIKDPRTLNKRVAAYGEVLSQNDIHALIEQKTGESLAHLPQVSAADLYARLEAARVAKEGYPDTIAHNLKYVWAQYCITKHVREDNTPENAAYLGYISSRDLYPDYKYETFGEFIDGLLTKGARRPYPALTVDLNYENLDQ